MNNNSKSRTSKLHLLTLLFVSAIVMTSIIPNVSMLGRYTPNFVFAQGNQTDNSNESNSSVGTFLTEPKEDTSDEEEQDNNDQISDTVADENSQQITIPEEDTSDEEEQDNNDQISDTVADENSQQIAPSDELGSDQNSTEETPSNDNVTVIVDPYLNNTNGGEVTLTDLKTIPEEVHVGDQFKVQATITNNLNEPINYKGKTCGDSPLNTKYDNKITVNQLIHCLSISYDALPPNGTATVESKGFEIAKAIAPGASTVDVALYFTAGSSPNTGIVPASFSFDIANGTSK